MKNNHRRHTNQSNSLRIVNNSLDEYLQLFLFYSLSSRQKCFYIFSLPIFKPIISNVPLSLSKSYESNHTSDIYTLEQTIIDILIILNEFRIPDTSKLNPVWCECLN